MHPWQEGLDLLRKKAWACREVFGLQRRLGPAEKEGMGLQREKAWACREGLGLHAEKACICGALQFASHCCRPDVSQSIKELCKHLIDPALRHYKAVQQRLSYLLATKDYGLVRTDAYIRHPTS